MGPRRHKGLCELRRRRGRPKDTGSRVNGRCSDYKIADARLPFDLNRVAIIPRDAKRTKTSIRDSCLTGKLPLRTHSDAYNQTGLAGGRKTAVQTGYRTILVWVVSSVWIHRDPLTLAT